MKNSIVILFFRKKLKTNSLRPFFRLLKMGDPDGPRITVLEALLAHVLPEKEDCLLFLAGIRDQPRFRPLYLLVLLLFSLLVMILMIRFVFVPMEDDC